MQLQVPYVISNLLANKTFRSDSHAYSYSSLPSASVTIVRKRKSKMLYVSNLTQEHSNEIAFITETCTRLHWSIENRERDQSGLWDHLWLTSFLFTVNQASGHLWLSLQVSPLWWCHLATKMNFKCYFHLTFPPCGPYLTFHATQPKLCFFFSPLLCLWSKEYAPHFSVVQFISTGYSFQNFLKFCEILYIYSLRLSC